ncbi:MAG: hypothetical protein RLZZ511_3856 [Cyanobacteriota bacterium]
MNHVEQATGSKAGFDVAIGVDAVDGEQIDVIEVEQLERSLEGFAEDFWGVGDDDFSLDD